MKLLKKQGKGNKPNRAQPITDSELDILYEYVGWEFSGGVTE